MQSYETTTTRLSGEDSGACALVQDLLPLYLEGEVSAGSRELITEHLARCERCAAFLAGAQSVRAQLRRDAIQRQSTTTAAAPERRALRRWQQALVAPVVFMICAVGGMASMGLAQGLSINSTASAMAGMVVGLGALGALLLLARALGPLGAERGAQLAGGVAIGFGAGFLLMGPVGPTQLIGVLLALTAVAVVEWAVLATRPRPWLQGGSAL